MKITDRIKTFEDACKYLGINPEHLYYKAPNGFGLDEYEKHLNAYTKLLIIIRALNEDWKPDWNNLKERKYYPWMYMGMVQGFGLGAVTIPDAGSPVAGRFVLQSEEKVKYLVTQFKDICEKYYLG